MNHIQVLITPTPAFAVVDLWGEANLVNVLGVVTQVEQDSHKVGYRQVLINFLDVLGALPEDERRVFGEVAAQRLGHLHRVALVVRREDLSGTTAATAKRHGLRMHTFDAVGTAVAWLTAPASTPDP